MKKRFTLLSTALLAVSLSAGAADNTEWKEGLNPKFRCIC